MAYLKFQLALDEALRCPDPGEALGLLGQKAPAGLQAARTRPALLPPETLRPLAGLYLNAGDLDAAAKLLFWDLRRQPIPDLDAVIIDPNYSSGGHFGQTDRFYLDAALGAGWRAAALLPRPKEGDLFEGGIRDLIPMREGQFFQRPASLGELIALNALFGRLFSILLPNPPPRLIVLPTASHNFFDGLAGYVTSSRTDGRQSLLLGIVDYYWGGDKPDHPCLQLFRHAFDRLEEFADLHVLAVAETQAIADGFRANINQPHEVVVLPYVSGHIGHEPRAGRNKESGLTVGFVGQTTPTRGAHLIPEIARRTLDRTPSLRWRVQLDRTRLPNQTSATQTLEELREGGRFEISPLGLELTDYLELLRSVDIMVLPFGKPYRVRSSAVAVECISSGCVQILPERSSMAALAREQGAGFVTFTEQTVEAVTEAVNEAIGRFEELKKQSMHAVESFRQDDKSLLRIKDFIESA